MYFDCSFFRGRFWNSDFGRFERADFSFELISQYFISFFAMLEMTLLLAFSDGL